MAKLARQPPDPGPYRRLSVTFFRRKTEVVARALIGKLIVHGERAGIIVECEAYLGREDRASHARFGETKRSRVMFGPGGIAYVYLCYGMYDMFNVVTGRNRVAGAVLVRALAPHHGLGADPAVARGPGKLCRAMGITREHSGVDLATDAQLFIARGPHRVAAERVVTGPRVGIDYAGEWIEAPLRFWIRDHPAVSR